MKLRTWQRGHSGSGEAQECDRWSHGHVTNTSKTPVREASQDCRTLRLVASVPPKNVTVITITVTVNVIVIFANFLGKPQMLQLKRLIPEGAPMAY